MTRMNIIPSIEKIESMEEENIIEIISINRRNNSSEIRWIDSGKIENINIIK